MKLYAIIYIFGKVAAFVGPWSEDKTDLEVTQKCNQAAIELLQRADKVYADHGGLMKDANGVAITRKDLTAKCVWLADEPLLNYDSPKP